MSKISLKHSGGNVVSLNSPTNAPSAADVAFKLPNADGTSGQALVTDASGNLSFASVAGGKILQVVQQIRGDTVSESSLGNGATGSTDVLTKAITPSSASSKVLVIMNATIAMSNGSERVGLLLHVGGSVIDAARADAASNRGRMSAGSYLATTDHFINLSQTFLHSPNTTSATTYSYRFISGSGTTTAMYLNRTHADSDATWMSRTTSNITLMEVAA